MKINNCKSCGARVEFSPLHQCLKCTNCDTLYPINISNQTAKHSIGWEPDKIKFQQWLNDNRAYKCGNCGAQVVYDKYDISTMCKYCGTNSLAPFNDLPGLRPEKIIPFRIAKEQAEKEFVESTKKRKFLPNKFKNNLRADNMGATYLSAFVFDGYVSATYRGVEKITETERTASGQTRTVTHYRHFSGKIEQQYNNIIVESNDKITQSDIADIMPYDCSQSVDYNADFTKGYTVSYYNQQVQDAEVVAKRQMLRDIESRIRRKYFSIDSLTISPTYSNIVYNYTLLPAYFFEYKYNKKTYLNVMNGQNGKVAGEVPRSPIKVTLFTIFILLLIGIPVLAIALLM